MFPDNIQRIKDTYNKANRIQGLEALEVLADGWHQVSEFISYIETTGFTHSEREKKLQERIEELTETLQYLQNQPSIKHNERLYSLISGVLE